MLSGVVATTLRSYILWQFEILYFAFPKSITFTKQFLLSWQIRPQNSIHYFYMQIGKALSSLSKYQSIVLKLFGIILFCATDQRECIALESCSGTLGRHNIMILNLDGLVSRKILHCKKSWQNCNINIMPLWCMNLSSGKTQLPT